MNDIIQLVIRGTLNTSVLDEVRKIHNETAGNPQGVAAARSLGDLSHNVFVPLADAATVGTELLILDSWNSLDGLGKFFADPQVQTGGSLIFKHRDPVVSTPASCYAFALQSPKHKPERFVGMLRGKVKSRDEAMKGFDSYARGAVNAARIHGQVSHQMFWRVDQPESAELIGIDIWNDADGMQTFYSQGRSGLHDVFVEKPVASLWKQPQGQWVEW